MLSRAARPDRPATSLHAPQHKQLVAGSRVVAAAGSALLIIRELARGSEFATGAKSTRISGQEGFVLEEEREGRGALRGCGNLESEAVSHILHALKGLVFHPNSLKLTNSSKGWRVHLFLRALRAAVSERRRAIWSRMCDVDMLQIFGVLPLLRYWYKSTCLLTGTKVHRFTDT